MCYYQSTKYIIKVSLWTVNSRDVRAVGHNVMIRFLLLL